MYQLRISMTWTHMHTHTCTRTHEHTHTHTHTHYYQYTWRKHYANPGREHEAPANDCKKALTKSCITNIYNWYIDSLAILILHKNNIHCNESLISVYIPKQLVTSIWSWKNWQHIVRRLVILRWLAPCSKAWTLPTVTSMLPVYMKWRRFSITDGSVNRKMQWIFCDIKQCIMSHG